MCQCDIVFCAVEDGRTAIEMKNLSNGEVVVPVEQGGDIESDDGTRNGMVNNKQKVQCSSFLSWCYCGDAPRAESL